MCVVQEEECLILLLFLLLCLFLCVCVCCTGGGGGTVHARREARRAERAGDVRQDNGAHPEAVLGAGRAQHRPRPYRAKGTPYPPRACLPVHGQNATKKSFLKNVRRVLVHDLLRSALLIVARAEHAGLPMGDTTVQEVCFFVKKKPKRTAADSGSRQEAPRGLLYVLI